MLVARRGRGVTTFLTLLLNGLSLGAIYALGAGIALSMVGILKSVHSLAATAIRFAAAGVFFLVPVGVVNHTAVLAMALATVGLSFVTAEPLLAAAAAAADGLVDTGAYVAAVTSP